MKNLIVCLLIILTVSAPLLSRSLIDSVKMDPEYILDIVYGVELNIC